MPEALKYENCHKRLVAILLVALLLTLPAKAGNLRGVVLDNSGGNPVPGAMIKIEAIDKTISTDKDGVFNFDNIPDGSYDITVSRIGYYENQISVWVASADSGELAIYLKHRPIEIAPQIVTAPHTHSKFEELSELSHTLKGKELQRELGQTLASTLKNETGLAMRSMGPAPARPVIRGLSGDRVTICEDGNKTTDLSATSPDHAVTIEPFSVERIEVVRGPKALKKTSTTIGGVVDVIRHEIPQDAQHNISGEICAYGETANRGYLNSARLIVPMNRILLRGDINRKNTSDLHTPAGKLRNSYSENLDYGIGGSYVHDRGFFGASYREFYLDYGIPGGFVGAHPNGVDIDMKRRQYNLKARYDIKSTNLENINVHLARAYYRHKEFEASGALGTEFKIVDYLGYADLNHYGLGIFDNGVLGLAFEFRDLDLGGLVFSPPSKSTNVAPYIIETVNLGRFNIETGIRYNYLKLKPNHDKPDSHIGNIRTRVFDTFSASISILYEISRFLNVGGIVSRSTRVPTLEELFSEGPHLAAYSYEIGNPDLVSEKGIGGELFAYLKTARLYLMTDLFYNDLGNYIIHRNTGEINWTTVLPIYAAMGVPARLYGMESQVECELTDRFQLTGSISYTIGMFKKTDSPLPQIPPLKGLFGVKYMTPKITVGLNAVLASKQNRVDDFEQPTDGYAVFNSHAQYTILTHKHIHIISINLDNIFDTEYRNHLSRVKSILPEAGRSIRLNYKLFFEL